MAETEHYVRDDVRGFLDMLEKIGSEGVDQVGAVAGHQQMRAMSALAEAAAIDLPVKRDLSCP